MEPVRYRPGEAIRWLTNGAERDKRSASGKSSSLVRQTGVDQRPFLQNVKTAATALYELGRGTYTELVHALAKASEFVLQAEHFDIVKGNSIQTVPYSRVKRIEVHGDRATLTLDKGHFTIKPFAYIVAGRAKAPIGWTRNGAEVPYELLIEELAARCRLELEEAA